jgi:hypothetical protein
MENFPVPQQPNYAIASPSETAASAAAAQARAMVEARYVMALRRPRVWDQVRQDIVKECSRPSFAHNKSSLYKKPIGAGVEGLGIRFVEVALRCMSNVFVETPTVFEDDKKEIVRVSVTELESNMTWSVDVSVSKTVERSKPLDDGSYISVRKNSYGKPVYTVTANDEDLLNKRAALISKAIRTQGLRVIPGDLQDEAEDIIRKIRLDKAAQDPDAERKGIADAFAGLNVSAAQLTEYLGHGLEQCSPAQLVELRAIYGTIRDGEATWRQVMENAKAEKGESPEDAAGGASVSELNAKINARKEKLTQPKTGETAAGDPNAGKTEATNSSAPAAPEKPKTKAPDNGFAITLADVLKAVASAKDADDLAAAIDLASKGLTAPQEKAEADVEIRAAKKRLKIE